MRMFNNAKKECFNAIQQSTGSSQEEVTQNKEFKKMYEEIEQELVEAQQEKSIVLLIVDFNCKIGSCII